MQIIKQLQLLQLLLEGEIVLLTAPAKIPEREGMCIPLRRNAVCNL